MSVTRGAVRAAAKQLIQDSAPALGTGVQFLLNDPSDYNTCIAQALRIYDGDVPNNRFVHFTCTQSVFRFILAGTGAILPPQPVAQPLAVVLGTPGAANYSYRVAARNAQGQGLCSQAVAVSNGPATLTTVNKVQLTWAPVPGAVTYDVFGRVAGSEALLHNVSALTYTDDGSDSPTTALTTNGLDGWIYDASELVQVWLPYFPGAVQSLEVQGQSPITENDWRVIVEPGPTVILELNNLTSAIGQVLRLEYQSPHVLDENSAAYTSITFGKVEAFETLVAAFLLRMVANRYLQNAGSTGLPNDVVDRRSQSDQAASRAKDFFQLYRDLIGAGDARAGASAFKEMDVLTQHNRGFLWHPSSIR